MTINFSRNLAIAFGILTPLAETVRRWNTWQNAPFSLFDDYILGAFLLYGAWRVGKNARNGQRFLTAAWGFTCGIAFLSFVGQLRNINSGEVDSAPIASEWVAVIKGIGLILAILALAVSLRELPESEH